MAEYKKPLPTPDAETQPYWDGTKAHELRVQRCSQCGKLRWPPRGFCPNCYSWQSEWVPLAQTGSITSYVVVHHATAAFADDAPYSIARVAIDGADGEVTLEANVLDCPSEDLKVGMPVEVVFLDVTDEVTLPQFRPRR